MTATITSIANATWTKNVRGYCFHGRTSTPASGSLWQVQTAVWFVSLAGVVTKRHVGLEFVHASRVDGERIDFLLVDAAGNIEWATPVTTTVPTGYDLEYWVNATSGSDGGPGSSGSPFQTFTAVNAAIRANASPGDEVRVHWSGETHTITSPTGGQVWRPYTTATGGTDLGIRVTWTNISGTAVISVNNGYGVVNMSGAHASGFVNDGVTFLGAYTTGGASVTGEAISWQAQTAGGEGPNVTLLDCEITGFHAVFTAASPLIAHSYVASGEFDWLICEGCTFGSTSAYHFNWDDGRYYGFYNCTFEDSKGDNTGSSMRFARQHYMSVTNCTFDRTANPSYGGNVIRINGGEATGAWDYGQYLSFNGNIGYGLSEGIEFDGAGATSDNSVRGVWIEGNIFSMINGYFVSFGGFAGTTHQMDVVEVRITNNAEFLSNTSANCMILISCASDNTSVNKVRSLMIGGNTMYQSIPQGAYSFSHIFLQAQGHVDNYVDGSIWMRSNYAHCAWTTGGGQYALCWMYGVLTAAKFVASERNIMSSAAASPTWRWTELIDLAAWRTASGNTLDMSSSQTGNITADMVDVTAAGFDPTPSAGTGPQVGAGLAGLFYSDAVRMLRDPFAPTAGSHEYDATPSFVPDPTFAGSETGTIGATIPVPTMSASGLLLINTSASGATSANSVGRVQGPTSFGTKWTLTDRGKYRLARLFFQNLDEPANFYIGLVTNAVIPSASTIKLADLTEIAAGNGYTAGGNSLARTLANFDDYAESIISPKATTIFFSDILITATGESIPVSGSGASYAVLLDDAVTEADRDVLAYLDLGSPITATIGNQIKVFNDGVTFDDYTA